LASKNQEWKWGDEQQEALTTIKQIITSQEVLLASPDFNAPIEIHTDTSSKYQLGEVIA
jgi:hypothetical protein